MSQLELFACASDASPDDDDYEYVDDDDTDIESDGDICARARCEHPREMHEDGKGACQCGKCVKFKIE